VRDLQVEGRIVPDVFLRVENQPEVGKEAYDQGAQSLYDFFQECLTQFLEPDLAPLGREIITCCLDNGTVKDYERLIPSQM
jgi:hypothetical protein